MALRNVPADGLHISVEGDKGNSAGLVNAEIAEVKARVGLHISTKQSLPNLQTGILVNSCPLADQN